jgi:two-component system OmpR family response regulator
MQILVVEGDARLVDLLAQTLRKEGHKVVTANDGQEGFDMAFKACFDLIVVDAMLPTMDGITFARTLREKCIQIPVLMTGPSAPGDIVKGLDSGADDYLTKPFSIDVFLARLRSVSRRQAIRRPPQLEVGDLVADLASREVRRRGKRIGLTQREYSLLEVLMLNVGRVVSRDSILETVWGVGSHVTANSVEVFVRLLRLKIDTHEPKLIHTVRGIGYMMKEPS